MSGFGTVLKEYLEFYKISQVDFAQRLGITQKHMNEILNEVTEISVDLMIAISLLTDIEPNYIMKVESKKRMYNYLKNKFQNEQEINNYLETFKLKEIYKLGWIDLEDKTSYVTNAINLLEYINLRTFDQFEDYFNNKIISQEEIKDKKTTFMWIKRCDKLAKRQEVKTYNSKNLKILLKDLKEQENKNTIKEITKLLNNYGIYLVLEESLDKNIRACSQVKGINPAIYINKNIKDKAEFYYSLYYELSKVKSYFNKLKKSIILSLKNEKIEKQEQFALNEMVSNEIYKNIKENIYNIDEICKKNKVAVDFAHFRLIKDKLIKADKQYQKIIE